MSDKENPKEIKKSIFPNGGKMGELVSSMDWSKTPLGPIEKWPQSLKTTVGLCLASNFPIAIAWGPHRVQIYNDGYWPICGEKHPASMGQDFKECWEAPWPVIGEAFESAANGQTKFLSNQRMFLNRYGFLEETFFTFTFSPVMDETGEVGGLFHPVTELTQQSIGERRLELLQKIGSGTIKTTTIKETISILMEILNENDLDIPFSALYLLNPAGSKATLEAFSGKQPKNNLLNLPLIPIEDLANGIWPLKNVLNNKQPFVIEDLQALFGDFECGPYPEPPKSAYLFPIELPNLPNLFGFFIAGVSSRRPLDESYKTFYHLLNATINNALTKAKANEDEEKRIKSLLELDKAKTAFFSNISHEFRTPLMLMLGPIDNLLNDKNQPLSPDQKQQMSMLHRNALRLQRLVNNLLDFSKIESGRIDAQFYPTNLSSYTNELASMFRSTVEKTGLEFKVNCVPLSQPVYVDHDMWEKIVLNLLSNAFKFTFQGSISLSMEETPKGIVLLVKDTGEGISLEDLQHLFSRFYRAQGTKSRSFEGSGIGLAFINELIKLHGGTISATSEIGKGSVFKVFIPFGKNHLPPENVVEENLQVKASNKSGIFLSEMDEWADKHVEDAEVIPIFNGLEHPNKKALLLLVDDNADMLDYVSRILIQNPDWEIAKAGNGIEALAFIEKNRPSLILSDIMMPGMDGFEFLKRIRSDARTSRIPVILLSARAGEEASIEGLEKGADDYIVKPFSGRELYARVKNQLIMAAIRTDNKDLMKIWELKNREMEEMTYIASHDLQQPLNTITTMLQMMEAEYGVQMDDSAKTYLKYALDSSLSMKGLILALLDYSRLGLEEPIESIDCNAIIEDLKVTLFSIISEKKAVLETGPLPILKGYPTKLKLLFQNLINNAIKFQAPGSIPKINITAKEIEGVYEFSVQDNGIGIEKKNFQKVFKIFQRLHTKKEYEGTGIGLAHCKKIVELHLGDIRVESEPGVGTTFFFTIKKNLELKLNKLN
jgi:signal transduction histidine kinase